MRAFNTAGLSRSFNTAGVSRPFNAVRPSSRR
ncbi:acyl-CoA synthetase [Mycobacterium tuberculosis]|nr:acyl-CoA synthetase [Mycobacterium tuberculosis]